MKLGGKAWEVPSDSPPKIPGTHQDSLKAKYPKAPWDFHSSQVQKEDILQVFHLPLEASAIF